jgi:tRNA (guanosine-2'-O-)-methyltransferase
VGGHSEDTIDGGAPELDAQDRRTLPSSRTLRPKGSGPTTRRQQRIRRILERRQPDLTVVLEDVHDPHNVSAVLRSCDAVGVLDVHVVYVHEEPPRRAFARKSSASAAKWMRIHRHDSIDECYAALRGQGQRILVAALGPGSEDLHALDLTRPTALVFGNEMRGLSDEAVHAADGAFRIPMMGMVESLNISVACAVTLYEALRQRQFAGRYEQPSLDPAELDALEAAWLKR